MHNHLIERQAQGVRETVHAFEAGHAAVVADKRLGQLIQVQTRDARFDFGGEHSQGFGNQEGARAQELDFFGGF